MQNYPWKGGQVEVSPNVIPIDTSYQRLSFLACAQHYLFCLHEGHEYEFCVPQQLKAEFCVCCDSASVLKYYMFLSSPSCCCIIAITPMPWSGSGLQGPCSPGLAWVPDELDIPALNCIIWWVRGGWKRRPNSAFFFYPQIGVSQCCKKNEKVVPDVQKYYRRRLSY